MKEYDLSVGGVHVHASFFTNDAGGVDVELSAPPQEVVDRRNLVVEQICSLLGAGQSMIAKAAISMAFPSEVRQWEWSFWGVAISMDSERFVVRWHALTKDQVDILLSWAMRREANDC